MTALDGDVRFEAALEECCRRVRAGEPLERCLADYPAEYHAELTRLVPLSQRVSQLRRDPSPRFVAQLEGRLVALANARRNQQLPAWRRLAVPLHLAFGRMAVLLLVGLLALVGGGVGAVQASEDSLPESPLYRVKEAREWVELALARNPESQVGVHARQITARGRELEFAVRAGMPRRVVVPLTVRLANSVDRMVDQALEARARGAAQPAQRAAMALRVMREHLERLQPQAQPDARQPLSRLGTFLRQQERRLAS